MEVLCSRSNCHFRWPWVIFKDRSVQQRWPIANLLVWLGLTFPVCIFSVCLSVSHVYLFSVWLWVHNSIFIYSCRWRRRRHWRTSAGDWRVRPTYSRSRTRTYTCTDCVLLFYWFNFKKRIDLSIDWLIDWLIDRLTESMWLFFLVACTRV